MRIFGWVILVLLVGCGAGERSGAAIEVSVDAPLEATAECLEVVALTATGEELDSTRFPRAGKTVFRVAVFPGGALGASEVQVEARGFTGTACDRLSARSERASVRFTRGIARVSVTLAALPLSADGGSDAGEPPDAGFDAGEPDAGVEDAGVDDAGAGDAGTDDAGVPDAGTDAGPDDAGFDAGVVDAGPPDDGGCAPPKDAGTRCGVGGVCALDLSCAVDFPYPPSNFDPRAVPLISGAAVLNCDTTFNSTALTFSANFCNQPQPVPTLIIQDGGIEVVVLAMAGLNVQATRTLTLIGSRPVVFAVFGDATIAGTVLAEAGADQSDCAGSHGTAGIANSQNAGSGGAGAGFGGFGGDGGAGGPLGGVGGAPHGNAMLVPLTGGCSGANGGAGGAAGGLGGTGGGAVQFSVAGTLNVIGRVGARGFGGKRGLASTNNGGGGGGGAGSGGAIFFEAQALLVQAAQVTANGGGGGEGGGTTNVGIDGESGSLVSATPAQGGDANPPNFPGFGGNGGAGMVNATNGRDQNNAGGGGGAGGGSVGRIRFNATMSCQVDGGVISPPATRTGCP